MELEIGKKNLEVGSVVQGKVTGVTKFGAFVEVAPQKTGLVHISEISNEFVKNVSDYFKEGQIVKVKILSINEDGKMELSAKQAVASEDKKVPNKFSNSKQNSQKTSAPNNFEDMMAKFKKISEEKLSGIGAATENRRRKAYHKSNKN